MTCAGKMWLVETGNTETGVDYKGTDTEDNETDGAKKEGIEDGRLTKRMPRNKTPRKKAPSKKAPGKKAPSRKAPRKTAQRKKAAETNEETQDDKKSEENAKKPKEDGILEIDVLSTGEKTEEERYNNGTKFRYCFDHFKECNRVFAIEKCIRIRKDNNCIKQSSACKYRKKAKRCCLMYKCVQEKHTQEADILGDRNGKGSDGDEENSAKNEKKDDIEKGKGDLTDDNLQDKEKRQKVYEQTLYTNRNHPEFHT